MAKGQQLKKDIQNQILAAFPGSFLYNDGKEIRICGTEGGERLQIKCVLTCAKENVENGSDTAIPGTFTSISDGFPVTNAPVTPERTEPIAPSSEEKASVAAMLKKLGL